MSQSDYDVLFQAFEYFLDSTADDSQEFQTFCDMCNDFFARLADPGYRMTNGELENSLMMLNLYIQRHPLNSRPHQDLHGRLSSSRFGVFKSL